MKQPEIIGHSLSRFTDCGVESKGTCLLLVKVIERGANGLKACDQNLPTCADPICVLKLSPEILSFRFFRDVLNLLNIHMKDFSPVYVDLLNPT